MHINDRPIVELYRARTGDRCVSMKLNADGPSGTYSSFVVYAAMPDVFAPYWCVQVEPVSHKRRWPINLFAYPIMKRRG